MLIAGEDGGRVDYALTAVAGALGEIIARPLGVAASMLTAAT